MMVEVGVEICPTRNYSTPASGVEPLIFDRRISWARSASKFRPILVRGADQANFAR